MKKVVISYTILDLNMLAFTPQCPNLKREGGRTDVNI